MATFTQDELHAALRQHFGFDEFRLGQEQLIRSICADGAVLGVMPTGSGKSLCYQLPAMLLDGLTVVVSPLISLMKDQVDQLTARGIPATYINSSVSAPERRERLQAAVEGKVRLLYVAPERFRPGFIQTLSKATLAQFVVDEAHCISQWGHDFRPDYMRLGQALKQLGAPRVAAFTATATSEVRADILRELSIDPKLGWVFGFHRPNLRFDVVPVAQLRQKLPLIQRYLRTRPGQAGIVYAATRKTVEMVAAALEAAGHSVGYYHGGLGEAERREAQNLFMAGQTQVMVATNAFGMGVDRGDLRFVIHYELTGSLEALYQEAGRAGRDRQPAEHTLLFNYADTRIQNFFIERREFPDDMPHEVRQRLMDIDKAKLREVVSYAYDDVCRHERILAYFGETLEQVPCGGCDTCLGRAAMGGAEAIKTAPRRARLVDQEVPARPLSDAECVVVQKVLSAVVRAQGQATASVLAQALVGASSPAVIQSPLVGTRSHGILKGWSRALLTRVITALARAGCLERVEGARRRYQVTTLGRDVMWRRRAVQLGVPAFGDPLMVAEDDLPPLDARSGPAFDRLREVRTRMAAELGVPGYVICSNATLARIASQRPETREDMLGIKGVGVASEARYGEAFRAALVERAPRRRVV